MQNAPHIKCLMFSISTILTCFAPANVFAQDTGVDWKYIGDTKAESLFYDAKSIQRLSDGHIKVWSKTVSDKSIDAYLTKKPIDIKLVKEISEKIKSGYVPPISNFRILTQDNLMRVVSNEYYANNADATPTGRILWELDCKNQQSRFLSVSIFRKGNWLSSSNAEQWSPAAPETNSAHIIKVLCH
jgi:hypothetical protein